MTTMTDSANYLELPCALLTEAYRQSAERNVLAALNPQVFFGYFSVCADGIGHGRNTTYPALDWGQTLEALLWLGRTDEVLASWDYVRSFQRHDGLLPICIMPDLSGQTVEASYGYTMKLDARGALWEHWWPGNPLLTKVTPRSVSNVRDDPTCKPTPVAVTSVVVDSVKVEPTVHATCPAAVEFPSSRRIHTRGRSQRRGRGYARRQLHVDVRGAEAAWCGTSPVFHQHASCIVEPILQLPAR